MRSPSGFLRGYVIFERFSRFFRVVYAIPFTIIKAIHEKSRSASEARAKVVHFPLEFHENQPPQQSDLLIFFLRAAAPGKRKNPNIAIRSLQTSPKQSAWQAWKPLPRGSGAPVEKVLQRLIF